MDLEVLFEEPLEISKGSEGMDVFSMKVFDVSIFVDAQTGMPIKKFTRHTSLVHPPFVSKFEAAAMMVLAVMTE